MATPMNPLDMYKSYTYHFELHMGKTWDQLKNLQTSISDDFTEPNHANGTLLINTRKDAHQTIDDVKFHYYNPHVDPTGTSASVIMLNMMITEPGAAFFIEKLQTLMTDYDVTNATGGAIFLLKIIFVGRNEDNSVEYLPPISIALNLLKLGAEFTHRGGTYELSFAGAAAGALSPSTNNQLSLAYAYSHKNITLRAKTVREALEQLQNNLNKNYRETFEKEINTNARPIRYEINLDTDINGDLNLVTKNTWAPDDFMNISFHPNMPIIDMVKRIMLSSKDVNDLIHSSLDGLSKEFHPNVTLPTYSMRYLLTDAEAVIVYDVKLYRGRDDPGEGDFEFDFLFATPAGKNVDVTRFEIKYDNMIAWIQESLNNSVSYHTDQDATVASTNPAHYSTNIVTPNKKIPRYVDQSRQNVAKKDFAAGTGDVQAPPASNSQENSGHVQLDHEGAMAARLAFNTIAEANGSARPQQAFEIRGHYNLMMRCTPDPEGLEMGFGQLDSIWIKVNIKNQQGKEFFYTGYYQLFTVENIFENGQFIQILTCQLMDRVFKDSASQASPQPVSSAMINPAAMSSSSESSRNVGVLITPTQGQ